jgi:hypothetical protein
VVNQFDRVAAFIENYYRYLYENDKRMTIRQMVGQISYALTGNLTCSDISSSLKEPYFNYNFANLFFGYVGLKSAKDTAQIKGIRQIQNLELDKISLDVDYKLFVSQDYSCFAPSIEKELQALSSKHQRHYRISSADQVVDEKKSEKELQHRQAIRRFYLIFSLAESKAEIDHVLNQVFGTLYTDYCQLISSKQSKHKLNEMRACFNTQGRGLAQRLTDKSHSWDKRGIDMLIPNGLAMSILGYVYSCPDMIGGGLVGDFLANDYQDIDQELFVRYAQVATFFPMMQFSLAPWKVLSKENLQIVKNCCKIHDEISEYIKELVVKASKDCTPIMRSMQFQYPNGDYSLIKDQFMLGDKYLVAPVVTKNTFERKVVLPEGNWVDDEGNTYQGNQTITIKVPLERLPYFKKI